MYRLCLFALMLPLAACSPNQSILQDKSAENPSPTAAAESTPTESRKFTVAELMDRVAHATPDSFLFPCTLNSYSDQSRADLVKLREQWLSKEQDARYLVAPSTGCVCPSVCVLLLADSRESSNKGAVLILDNSGPEKYYWLSRDIDLSRATLGWDGATPSLT